MQEEREMQRRKMPRMEVGKILEDKRETKEGKKTLREKIKEGRGKGKEKWGQRGVAASTERLHEHGLLNGYQPETRLIIFDRKKNSNLVSCAVETHYIFGAFRAL